MSVERTKATGGMETSYGFRQVAEGEKQPLVNEVFHKVADRYDLMNDLMSAGMHRVWKDAAVAWLNPPKRSGWRSLDVAGGTGDIAFKIVEASQRNAHVTVLDINGSMLSVGRDRAEKRGLAANVDFVEANAEELPFEDAGFDAYTIAFGIRNVPRIDAALSEAFRVLKPGGRFLCLEFSEVDMPLLEKAGVTIMAGTDAGFLNSFDYPALGLHQELALYVKNGLTPAEALSGQPIDVTGVPLYTDARHYAAAGIPTVLYGAGPRSIIDANAHSADEHLRLADLKMATEVVAEALATLLAG